MNGTPKEAKAEIKEAESKAPAAGELMDIGAMPEPSADEAVKEALDVAQSMGPEERANDGGIFWGTDDFDDSVSIYQYVEEAEKRAHSLFDGAISGERGPLEKLEVLDVATEFGRPDELTDMEDDRAVDDGGQAGIEDTQNLTVRAISRTRRRVLVGSTANKGAGVSAPARDLTIRAAFENSETQEASHEERPLASDGGMTQNSGTPAVDLEPAPEERWDGDLAQCRVWNLLAALFVDKKTGVLVIEQASATVRLFIDEGEMVMATTTSKKNSQLSRLRASGYVAEVKWDTLMRDGETGPIERHIGATLLQKGLISAPDLLSFLRDYYRDVAVDTFNWTNGRWRFLSEAVPIREQIPLVAQTPHLVWEGIRSLDEDAAHLPLPSGTAVPTKKANGPYPLKALGLSEEELAVYEMLDGRRTVTAMASLLKRDAPSVARLVSDMAAVGLLDIAPPRTPPSPPDTLRPRASLDRAAVNGKVAEISEGSYFDILEVQQGASGDEVREAYLRLTQTFSADHFENADLADLGDQGRLIRKILDEAYEVLGKLEMRGPYSRADER